ncbi:E3 ubiquitin-protein ligase MBR1-like [Lolium rigidum]|uniref:E3 ubiquitin-protein ligase MBR1-like n=1 Tax=Lolium rigidum TaxID=89674 RepID=UPI001F5CD7D5|nr:E3 ubiquitin-protein ligase MBR1-like [Lolium rigidum]
MEEYLSRRSKTAIGYLRRGSSISSRERGSEETTCQNTDGQGSPAGVNPVKTRLADNQERPRYLHGSYNSASSTAISRRFSKVPLRKFGEEKRRQSLLEGIDIAQTSRRKAEANNVEGSKKIVAEKQSLGASRTRIKDDKLGAHDPEVSHSAGSSDVPAHTAESLVRSASLSSGTHRQKDKELNLGIPGYSCSSSFTNQPTIPRIPSVGAKPQNGLSTGEQRHGPCGLKNLGCSSVSDVLPSGCSSDSAYSRRFDAVRKRVSDGESSSRSRVISGPSGLGRSHTLFPSISGPRIRSTDQSAPQQTLGSLSRNIQDSAVSVRTRRTSRDSRFRISEERQDGMLSLHESTVGNQQSMGVHFSVEEVSSESSIRPLAVELPHAIYSAGRQVSSTRTTRGTSSSHFEETPPQTSRGLLRERRGHRRINMEGIAEVLLALDRIEQEAELTYEQLRVLETNLLLGAFASQDQHRDMRMDIDNMSYEELLELEERIGSVSTALSEEQFAKCIRRRLYRRAATEVKTSIVDDNKCSICQEEFLKGEEVGRLRCEHQYHVCCIRQWLLQKNWCPICKASALRSLN